MKKFNPDMMNPHKAWLGLLTFSLALLLTGSPLFQMAGDVAAQRLHAIQSQRAEAQKNLSQLRDDIETAQKLKNEMSLQEAEAFLAPVDRLQAASLLEEQAAALHVGNFTYTIAPEEKIKITALPEPQELSVSLVTLQGDMPGDNNVYHFVDSLRDILPGRLRLQQLSIERLGAESATLQPVNVRFSAKFEWLSNGTVTSLAGAL